MANIPVAGFPQDAFMGQPDNKKGRVFKMYGFEQMEKSLAAVAEVAPKFMRSALTEIGLYGERETKLRTPVDYGLLRASIGHFEPAGIKPPSDAEGKVMSDFLTSLKEAEEAVFKTSVQPKADKYSVTWGTNVHYAPYIEDGFTMNSRRTVYIRGVGWRRVNPFSYRGAHMFAQGLDAASKMAPDTVAHWTQLAFASQGFGEV